MQHQLSTFPISALAALITSCGGSSPSPPSTPTRAPIAHPVAAPTSAPALQGGSSDGVTCEEAQDQNVEEVTIGGAASGPDLSAKDLGPVLNNGQYLDACGVPNGAKVSVCAAVKQGAVLGVTIALDPADPEMEKCVAAEVRKLAFPVHPKMDIVKTQF